MNIDTDNTLDELTLIKYLKSIDSPFPKIQEVYEQVNDILNSRVHVFPQYTLHNTGHSFRIMEYMSKLVGDITKLNELEITLMVLFCSSSRHRNGGKRGRYKFYQGRFVSSVK